jgi:hypothetical protein
MDRRFLVQQDEDRYVAIAPIDLHKETPSAVQAESSAQHLPIELVILIITHVRERSDYLSLCNTSKTLRTIVEPLLYRIVDVTFISPSGPDSLDISRFTGLCSTLSRNTHISSFVTELRINLVNWRICRKFIGGDSECEPLLKPCTCDEVDAQVGDAVTSLLSLERLYVYCFLCENKSGRHRHLSFTGLSVKLTAFYLRCNCEDGCEPALAQLISAKSINSASALSIQWRRSFVNRTLGDSVLGRLAEPEYLSNLKTFVHDDSIFADMLVIRRRITRLGFKYTPTLSLQMIDKSHTTHLLIPDGLAYLKKQLRRWPDAFLNLRCIGTLYIRAYEVGISQCQKTN